MILGGGWDAVADACRVTNTYAKPPTDVSNYVGLRLIRVPAGPPFANADADRKAAEYVLSVGGVVRVNGTETDIKTVKELPKEPFRLTTANLSLCRAANDTGMATFAGVKHLTELNVSETQVSEAGLVHVHGCKDLVVLSVGNGDRSQKFGDAALAKFAECKNLRILLLGGSHVTDAGLVVLKVYPDLLDLRLGPTVLSDAGLTHIKECKQLRFLFIVGTKVTAKGVAELAKALPQCRIEWDGGVIEPGKVGLGADRAAAEWVLSVGGTVNVNGKENGVIKAVADLPKGAFRLTGVHIVTNPKVTDAALAVFKGCKHLTELNLYDVPVTKAALAHFKDSSKTLKQFILGGDMVTDEALAEFKDFKSITYLWLHSTKLTDAGLAHFADLKELNQIHMVVPKVTDAGLVVFKDCTKLRILQLNDPHFTDAGFAHFKNCTNLSMIILHGTKLTDTGLTHFKDCKALYDLDVSNTAVTDAGLAPFKDYKDLHRLTVKQTKVTAKLIDEFRKALPKCKIEWDGGVIEPK